MTILRHVKIVDLSHTISPESQTYSVYPTPQIIPWTKYNIQGFESEAVFLSTHTGTHMDAPYHFDPLGMKIDEIPLSSCATEAVVLDLTGLKPKARIERGEIEEAEDKGMVSLEEGCAVLFWTGWDRYAGKPEYLKEHPGVCREGAEYLASRKVSLVGVDTPDLDHPDEKIFSAHQMLLSKNIVIVENLRGLGELGSGRVNFVALPLKIRGATASPVRAIAIVEENPQPPER